MLRNCLSLLSALVVGFSSADACAAAAAPSDAVKAVKAVHAPSSPGLGERVFSPEVVRGELELGLRAGRLTGGAHDGDAALVAEAGYGFTDRLYGALVVQGAQQHGKGMRGDAVAAEGVFELGRLPGGVDAGVYAEYAAVSHHKDAASAKLLLRKAAGAFEGRLNVGAHQTLGDDHREYGYAASTAWRVAEPLALGVQAFGVLGDQDGLGGRREHYVGPVAEATLARAPAGVFEVQAGYLFAAGSARDHADGQLRLLVTFKRHLGGGGHASQGGHGH